MSAAFERDLGWMPAHERATNLDLRPIIQQRIEGALRMMDKAVDDAVKARLVLMGWVPPPAEPCNHTIGLRFDYSSTDVWCLSEVDDRPHAVEEMRSEVERARLRGARTATQLRGTYQDLVAGVQAEVAAMTPLQVFEAACQIFRHCPDCGASLAHLWAPQPPETARGESDED